MSFALSSLVQLLPSHASPAVLAIGFSVLLVLSLVAAEEIEERRIRPPRPAEG